MCVLYCQLIYKNVFYLKLLVQIYIVSQAFTYVTENRSMHACHLIYLTNFYKELFFVQKMCLYYVYYTSHLQSQDLC